MCERFRKYVLIAVIGLFALPVAAAAQSVLTGLVRDASGAVLPGVTVEASSPVLIEKVRVASSDDQGRYRIVDLRPGVYQLTFALAGFNTLVRSGIDLPSDFVATIDGNLTIGALEESVTVSGQAPTVDVQTATKTQVLTSEMLSSLPSTKNPMAYGQLVVGTKSIIPDVGGARQLTQTYMRAHGATETAMSFYLDGLQINAMEQNMRGQNYINNELIQEVSVLTSALSADTSAGGVRMNYVMKDGANTFNATGYFGGSSGAWQSDNLTDELQNRGVRSANSIERIENFAGSFGGPIMRDKIWFLGSWSHTQVNEWIADFPRELRLTDGTSFIPVFTAWMEAPTARLTFQLTPKNKVAGFLQRSFKNADRQFAFGTDPVTSGSRRDHRHAMYAIGQVRWTSTVSNRLLLEAGWGFTTLGQTALYQPGVEKPKYLPDGQLNPAWIANAQRVDTALNINPQCSLPFGCTTWISSGAANRMISTRVVVPLSATYVTGSHSLKLGVQWAYGRNRVENQRQGDLIQNYVDNRPQSVTVYNTPYRIPTKLNHDVGVYLQDTWTIGRLTLNPGVRMEYFDAQMSETFADAGRFVPARRYDAETCLPCWNNLVAPRLSAAYDVFGKGRTALKASFNKYYGPYTTTLALDNGSAAILSEARNWFDADLIPGTSTRSANNLPTNGDNIAQDNEIGPSASLNFGTRPPSRIDPDLRRFYNWEYTAGIQHELFAGTSVSFNYYRRSYRDFAVTDRTHISPSDYTSFQVKMPDFSQDPTLVGVLNPNEMLTIYNLNPAKRGLYNTDLLVRNSTTDQSVYNGFEPSFSARLRRKLLVYGGVTFERQVSVFCDTRTSPNGAPNLDLQPENQASPFSALQGRFCDERNYDMPWRTDLKFAGSYPIAYGIGVAAALQSVAGVRRNITWTPAANLFPGGRTNVETLILNVPGSAFLPRYNQLDLNVKKDFRWGRTQLVGQVDIYNALNASTILATNSNIGSSLGRVETVLLGRIPRLSLQFKW